MADIQDAQDRDQEWDRDWDGHNRKQRYLSLSLCSVYST